MTLRILVVEDDKQIRLFMQSALSVEGFDVSTAVSVSEAQALLLHKPPEIVLLDLGLPDGDGASLVSHIRQHSNIPIIIVSARHAETEKIGLLDAGADDYLVKPFSVGELLARIRVAMRHRGTRLAAAITVYQHEDLYINLETRSVQKAGESIHLTPTEYKLLARLVQHAGRVMTHRQLLTDVWGPEFIDHIHYLRLYMAQLRAKLEKNPLEPSHLLTEAGVGYRLTAA